MLRSRSWKGEALETTCSCSEWSLWLCSCALVLLFGCAANVARAQTPQDAQNEERSIIPVFDNARSRTSTGGAGAKAVPVYRKSSRPLRQKPSPKNAASRTRQEPGQKTIIQPLKNGRNQGGQPHDSSAKAPGTAQQNAGLKTRPPLVSLDSARNLGVTVWRLQPESQFADFNQPACRGSARSIGQGEGREIGQLTMPTMLTPPLRASADTLFRTGDRVRLSIESTRPGYLYIINREFYADETYGPAKLIFPTQRIRGGNNYLAPGSPVEYPDLCDNANYFEFLPLSGPKKPVAEALIMMVTDRPLAEVGMPRDALRLPESLLASWEARWSGQTNVYELDAGEGHPYTVGELNAGFEIRVEGHEGGRGLGLGGPQPQTLYSVNSRGDGVMTTTFLWYE